jgi:hypothetical protein
VLVVAGYLVPITWTGFTGNTMWDWVKLVLMPVLVPLVLAPLLVDSMSERLQRAHDQAAAGGLGSVSWRR